MGPLRVLVVEDSLTVRRRLVEVLEADPGIRVVGEAADGKGAIEQCASLRPDVVTIDMMLPVMTGLAATEYIMAYCPTPILIVSASTNRGELFKTYDALAAGAVDVLEKPRGDESDGEWEQRFCAAVKLISRIKVITHPRARLDALGRRSSSAPAPAIVPASRPLEIVALGASTGGPGALVQVLRDLPDAFPLPLVIVLHMDEVFGGMFAEWLDGQTKHRVAYARDGEPVASFRGRVAMAPAGRHLVVAGRTFRLTTEPPRHSCRPSIDALFESVARDYKSAAVAGLLTGMGRDGAQGLLDIRRAGGLTIAQDEATSVVYGMPREAAILGAAELTLPLEGIGRAITRAAEARRESEP
jgi:two-component system chemotaxis response regulator CheB